MIEFIYNYGDVIQFFVVIFNYLAVGAAAIAVIVAIANHGKCCHGHGHHHGECCEPKDEVKVEKFVD